MIHIFQKRADRIVFDAKTNINNRTGVLIRTLLCAYVFITMALKFTLLHLRVNHCGWFIVPLVILFQINALRQPTAR